MSLEMPIEVIIILVIFLSVMASIPLCHYLQSWCSKPPKIKKNKSQLAASQSSKIAAMENFAKIIEDLIPVQPNSSDLLPLDVNVISVKPDIQLALPAHSYNDVDPNSYKSYNDVDRDDPPFLPPKPPPSYESLYCN